MRESLAQHRSASSGGLVRPRSPALAAGGDVPPVGGGRVLRSS